MTDTANVTTAGALMDSEVTNLADVKAFDTTDYATAAQGTTANAALPKAGGAMTGAITTNSTFDGRDVATDGTKLDGIATSANNYSLPASVIHQTELSSSVSSTSTTVAANSAAVKAAYDRSWPNTTYSVGDGGLSQINFTSADHTKLNGIEASANVTDAANVGSSLTAFTTFTGAVGGDTIPVYDASTSTWKKSTITNAALQGPTGDTGPAGAAGATGPTGASGTVNLNSPTFTGNVIAADLTVSGGVYLGGTGAVNKLDDYEEGTWTPSGTNLNAQGGRYTKVGNLVTCTCRYSASGGNVGGTLSGLPFTSVAPTSYESAGGGVVTFQNAEAVVWSVRVTSSSNSFGQYKGSSGNAWLTSGKIAWLTFAYIAA